MTIPKTEAKPLVITHSNIADLPSETFTDPRCGTGTSWKTLTSASKTATNSLTSGIATIATKPSYFSAHSHPQAEMYHFMQGEGIVEIDGVKHSVRKGTVVFIPGNAKHGVRNTSEVEELVWFYVFAVDDLGEIGYRFEHEDDLDKS